MVFDLICRSCGACEQRNWDPSDVVAVTPCPACERGMSVIGISFPADQQGLSLKSVLEVIQGAGIVPLAVERSGRRRRRQVLPPAA
jgi:hypothetical protein